MKRMTKEDINALLEIADALKDAALKVVGNEADRSLHQHIGVLANRALEYSKRSGDLRVKYC